MNFHEFPLFCLAACSKNPPWEEFLGHFWVISFWKFITLDSHRNTLHHCFFPLLKEPPTSMDVEPASDDDK